MVSEGVSAGLSHTSDLGHSVPVAGSCSVGELSLAEYHQLYGRSVRLLVWGRPIHCTRFESRG